MHTSFPANSPSTFHHSRADLAAGLVRLFCLTLIASNYPPPPCAEGSGMIHGWDES